MDKFPSAFIATGILLAYTSSALAEERFCPRGNAGYATDSRGNVVLDGAGNCVRSSAWTPALVIPACEGGTQVAAPEPAPKMVPTPRGIPTSKTVDKTVSLTAGALFDTDKAIIKDAGKPELNVLAAQIKGMKTIQSVGIAGHTDSVGAAAYNQQLSMRRAIAVKNYLMNRGVDPRIMSTLGEGESRPVASNATAAGRAKNRRVEINIRGGQ